MTDNILENFKPIKQIKASDEVSQQLRGAIFDGVYQTGDKLPSERELIESFQVSRTVVREAIKGLEASGLVEIRQGATGGAFVKSMDFELLSSACSDMFFMGKLSFSEICQARLVIDPIIASMAAKACNEEWAAILRHANEHESDTLEYPETVALRQKVHFILADMCGNRLLGAIGKSLMQLLSSITHRFKPDTNDIHPAGLHTAIIEAVISGDAARAEAEMYQHIKGFSDILQRIEQDFREQDPKRN